MAVFLWFDAMAGEGVFDFLVRTVAMCTLVYAVARTAGSASLNFCRAPSKGGWHGVEGGHVRSASDACATGTVCAIRSEIVWYFLRTVETTCGCQALGGAMRLLRRTQLLPVGATGSRPDC